MVSVTRQVMLASFVGFHLVALCACSAVQSSECDEIFSPKCSCCVKLWAYMMRPALHLYTGRGGVYERVHVLECCGAEDL